GALEACANRTFGGVTPNGQCDASSFGGVSSFGEVSGSGLVADDTSIRLRSTRSGCEGERTRLIAKKAVNIAAMAAHTASLRRCPASERDPGVTIVCRRRDSGRQLDLDREIDWLRRARCVCNSTSHK